MARARIELTAFGFDSAARHIRGMGRRAQDFRPVFVKLMRWIRSDERFRFAAQPWRPLDPDTLDRKKRQGQDPRILRATGALQDALTLWSAPGGVRRFDRREAFYGLDPTGVAFYGKFHHLGQGVPKRELIELTPKTAERFYQAVLDHLLGR